MRGELRRHGVERRRALREAGKARRDDDPLGLEGRAVVEPQAEAARTPADQDGPAPVEVRDVALLEPAAVADEALGGQRRLELAALLRSPGRERREADGVRDVGR